MKKDRLWSLFLIVDTILKIVCEWQFIQIVFRYQEADSVYDDIEKEVFVPDIPAENGKRFLLCLLVMEIEELRCKGFYSVRENFINYTRNGHRNYCKRV